MRWLKFRKFKKFRKPPKQPDPNQIAPGAHDPNVDLDPDVCPQGVFRSVIWSSVALIRPPRFK